MRLFIASVRMIWQARRDVRAAWGARGLEWEIPSPPPTQNFTVSPIVTEGTHQYMHGNQEVGLA